MSDTERCEESPTGKHRWRRLTRTYRTFGGLIRDSVKECRDCKEWKEEGDRG